MNLLHNNINNMPLSNSIYLCNSMLQPVCKLNSIDHKTVKLKLNLIDFSTLDFSMNKYINVDGEKVISNAYDVLGIKSYLFVDSIGYFKVTNEPSLSTDSENEVKTISAKGINCELMQKNLVSFKVNCGTSDSREYLAGEYNIGDNNLAKNYVSLYNRTDKKLSLLDLILEDLKGWHIDYVDDKVDYIQEKFEVDATPIYTFMKEMITPRFKCVFVFDILNLGISVYSVDNIGNDTQIYLSKNNYLNKIDVSCNDSSVYTVYSVAGGDGIDNLTSVNYGDKYIEDKTYFMNTKYFPQDTINKYYLWHTAREYYRDEYIKYSKNYISYNETATTLYYKVPNDVLSDTWSGFTLDELSQYLTQYYTMIYIFENNDSYKTNGTFDENKLKDSGEGYYTYIEYKGIAGNILTAIYNLLRSTSKSYLSSTYISYKNKYAETDGNVYPSKKKAYGDIRQMASTLYQLSTTPDKKKFEKDWETNWGLYGVSELQILIEKYTEQINVGFIDAGYETKYYEQDKTYSQLPDSEKGKYVGESSYNTKKTSYNEINTKLVGAKNALTERQSQYDTYVNKRDAELTKVNNLCSKVDISNFSFFTLTDEDKAKIMNKIATDYGTDISNKILYGSTDYMTYGKFTDDELLALSRLDEVTAYTNSNIITTSNMSTDEQFDKKKELLEDAYYHLSIASQPQISFSVDVNNFLSLADNQTWLNQLNIGNFIYLEVNDNFKSKVRLIGIEYNPFEYSENLTLTFSSSLKSSQGISDFVYLLGESSSSTSSSKGSSSSSGSGTGNLEITNDVLQLIANSGIMNKKLNGIYNDAVDTASYNYDYLFAETLVAKLALIDEASFGTLTSDTGFIKYLESNLIVSGEVDTSKLVASLAEITVAQMGTLTAETAFVQSLQSKILATTSSTAVVEFAEYLVANHVSLNELFAQNTTTEFITLGKNNSTGDCIRMNDHLIQFVDKDGNVYIQLGKDALGANSFVLRNTNGDTIINGNGITSNAIADGLIVNNMVASKGGSYSGLSADKLNIDSVVSGINGGSTRINASKVWFDEEKQTLNTMFSQMDSSLKAMSNSLSMYDVKISSNNGQYIEGTTVLTANVYILNTNDLVTDTPFTYQWYKNGKKISNATNKTLTITLSDVNHGKLYTCEVSTVDED